MGKCWLYRGVVTLAFSVVALACVTLVTPSALFAQSAPPYPPSPAITGWSWAPVEEITRAPQNGQSFAEAFVLTGGDDNGIYLAYEDGRGFAPQAVADLNLGMARIAGEATSFEGSNIPSEIEQVAGSGADQTASSLLMVDHMLYMWVHGEEGSGDGCQLAWSSDGGGSWSWSNWAFAEFGECVFVNYGANYAGARDEFIYVVAPDTPDSNTPADQFILMRVPQERISDRGSYEYLASVGPDGTPMWTADINGREAIFTHPGRVLHSSITYNEGLGRYLWWQQHSGDNVDPNSTRGMGIYDAPQPWGPWTTAFYTENWDVDPGESAAFPSQWMGADGTTVHLAFAGDEMFSVRAATLTTSVPDASTERVTDAVPSDTTIPDINTPDINISSTVTSDPDAVGTTVTDTVTSDSVMSDSVISDDVGSDTAASTMITSSTGISNTVLEGAAVPDEPQPGTPTPDGSAPEWANTAPSDFEQSDPAQPTAPAAPDNSEAFESPLPTPIADISALQSPLDPPLDSVGSAAGFPVTESQQITQIEFPTITVPITVSRPLTDAARLSARLPLSNAGGITETELSTNRNALLDSAVEEPEATPTVVTVDVVTVEPTPPATATPVPITVAMAPPPENPLTSIFGLETLIMVLLCLVSVSVSVLGFSALIVTVLYARAQSHADQMRKDSQLQLYRTRDLPIIRSRWR